MRRVTRTQFIPLWKWFPKNDEYATSIARLCILREDLFLELQGYGTQKIDQLDENSFEWRTLYFFRNFFRTISEVRSTVETLRKIPEFQDVKSQWNKFEE